MPTGIHPWLWAITGLPDALKRRIAWLSSSAVAGVMPVSGRRTSSALTLRSSPACASTSTTRITESPAPPKTAKGLDDGWSLSPSRRSSSSTVCAGVAGLDEVAKAAVSRTTGTTTRNRISPVKTPRTVRKNCFMAEP